MSGFSVSEATRMAQGTASDPRLSVFVSANAGSGKTHVLTERVVRLLLSGAEPGRILCLTYTKAAAAEMSNRVFTRLAAWATADDETLANELSRLGEEPAVERLAEARRLFAKALETPGGLKIQTIHAFCEAILHQFPLEAGVPGHFEVMESAESALLIAEARRMLIGGATHGLEEQKDLSEAFADALSLAGEFGLDRLISEIVMKRDAIRRHMEETGGLAGAVDFLAEALGIDPAESEATIIAAACPAPSLDDDFCRSLSVVAKASDKVTDAKFLARLGAYLEAGEPAARYEALLALLFKKDGDPYKSLATKAVTTFHEDFQNRIDRAVEHLSAIRAKLATLKLFRASRAALVIADQLERDYGNLKRRRGRLDFEDLIVRTADLLARSEAADWVHFKLDKGLDHILVDEAQDTSARQWQVVRSLVEEFFTGRTAREGLRTVFAVGDEKQSIYSFQGALPAMFADERRRIEERALASGRKFRRLDLHQSFRSAADVLSAVDAVFEDPENRRGLSSTGEAPAHQSARSEPGLVEVWPVVQAQPTLESEDWLKPVDIQPDSAPVNVLARRIASQIGAWMGDPITVKGKTRALTPGDVLILVRKRSAFVEAMGKALRDANLPVAGADRLVLTDHIAIQDLMALGRVAANAEDDLSLAAVLKSPLFGFSDDELMALALSRGPRDALYLALRRLVGFEGEKRLPDFVAQEARTALREKAARAFDRLERQRMRAGFEGVFAFYARVLGPEGGRASLVARLGSDAGEVIDAFLDLALAEETKAHAGLDAFLADIEANPPEIKREMEHGRGEVRIMTTHASKGLEAPVVFLVDPGSAPFSHSHGARLMSWEDMPGLYPGQAPGFLWRADKSLETSAIAALKETERLRAEEEYHRLLYVGMTRAADRLVVCGTAGVRGPNEQSWLQRVQASLGPKCEEICDDDGAVVAWRFGKLAGGEKIAAPQTQVAQPAALDLSRLPPEALAPRPLTPSSAGASYEIEPEEGGEAAGVGGFISPVLGGAKSNSLAVRRGLAVHKLLEILPETAEAEREAHARAFLASPMADLPPAEQESALGAVLSILSDPAFAAVFASGSRGEVPVSGRIVLGGEEYSVSGTIDRLALSPDRVLIVDYKTNRSVPVDIAAVPPAYLLQLALYRALLRSLFPLIPVEAALLFTEAPVLMPVAGEALDEALARRARSAAGAGVSGA
ncbi:double-strand break repair helicase AddA [Consotaella salsifontis]|uniref:DNA 3'-5' helicase n=1 Tax=Consotaella salsifontis TaxID=1365950 RepID=A0A1T4QHZ4_9HYPH|nr:double-strand break repair helicase AddA [Consotaella salsifontis]SKA03413.1 DNA helicase/exodeoxyribonuclease V, subunit A [Consotaella salsifontis]